MLINIYCAKCIGIQAVPVNVEVDINSGIGIHLVGLADIAVKESLLRIMTALQSLGFHIPGKKIVINLAPADMHKNGSGYDLPIALGIIAASGQRNLPALTRYIIMGELISQTGRWGDSDCGVFGEDGAGRVYSTKRVGDGGVGAAGN